jgi:hypothetical protein
MTRKNKKIERDGQSTHRIKSVLRRTSPDCPDVCTDQAGSKTESGIIGGPGVKSFFN